MEVNAAGQEKHEIIDLQQCCSGIMIATESTGPAITKQSSHVMSHLMMTSLSDGNSSPN